MGGKTDKQGTEWYDGCVGRAPEIAARDTAAQVIPTKITEALFASSNAELVVGTPTLLTTQKGREKTITVETAEGTVEHPCEALVLACGPWTSTVAQSLGVAMSTTVLGLKAYSILLEPKQPQLSKPVDDSCLFMDWRGDPFAGEFELYPRLDGVYVCG
jgi:glycine/D-amino acid oxidase-like deaminating enzyme